MSEFIKSRMKKTLLVNYYCPRCGYSKSVRINKGDNPLDMECPACSHDAIYTISGREIIPR